MRPQLSLYVSSSLASLSWASTDSVTMTTELEDRQDFPIPVVVGSFLWSPQVSWGYRQHQVSLFASSLDLRARRIESTPSSKARNIS